MNRRRNDTEIDAENNGPKEKSVQLNTMAVDSERGKETHGDS